MYTLNSTSYHNLQETNNMNFLSVVLILGCITSTLAVYSKKSCRQECASAHDCPVGSECKLVGCNSLCKSSGLDLAQLGLNGGIGPVDPLLSVGSLHNDRLLANGGVIRGRAGHLIGGIDRTVDFVVLGSEASLLGRRRNVLNSDLGLGLGGGSGLRPIDSRRGLGQVFHGVDPLHPVIDPIDMKY